MIPTMNKKKRRDRQESFGSETTATHQFTTSIRGGEKEIMQANHKAAREAPERPAERVLDRTPERAVFRRVFARPALAACSGLAAAVERELPRYLFFALFALLVAVVVFAVGAHAAFAQQAPAGGQDGGDAIGQTLVNVRNYLAGLSFGVGGIGFVASLLVKGYASINENAHAYAAMGMKGSLWCIVAGVIVTPVLSIAAGLAGGGGG